MPPKLRSRLIGCAGDDLNFSGHPGNVGSDKNLWRNSRDFALLRKFLAARLFLCDDARIPSRRT